MNIMHSTVQNRRRTMNEKTYKTMRTTGAGSIAIGIVVLIGGVVCGVLGIINGARLLRKKSEIIF